MYTRNYLILTCLSTGFQRALGCTGKTKEECAPPGVLGCEWFGEKRGCERAGGDPVPCKGTRRNKCRENPLCTWQSWKTYGKRLTRCQLTGSGCEFWPTSKQCHIDIGCHWEDDTHICKDSGHADHDLTTHGAHECDNGFERNVVHINWQFNNAVGRHDIRRTIKSAVDTCFNVIILDNWVNDFMKKNEEEDHKDGKPHPRGTWGSQVLVTAAEAFDELPKGQRHALIKYAHANGAVILLSAGGRDDDVGSLIMEYPMSASEWHTGSKYGQEAAKVAKSWGIDGVDFNFQNGKTGKLTSSAFTDGKFEAFAKDAILMARSWLGEKAIITVSPKAEFQSAVGYYKPYVNLINAGVNISWLNIQFYHEDGAYGTYEHLFVKNEKFPGTAVSELVSAGVPAEKIVVGKIIKDSKHVGFIPPARLNNWACQLNDEADITVAGFMAYFWQSEYGHQTVEEAMAINVAWGPVVAKQCPLLGEVTPRGQGRPDA